MSKLFGLFKSKTHDFLPEESKEEVRDNLLEICLKIDIKKLINMGMPSLRYSDWDIYETNCAFVLPTTVKTIKERLYIKESELQEIRKANREYSIKYFNSDILPNELLKLPSILDKIRTQMPEALDSPEADKYRIDCKIITESEMDFELPVFNMDSLRYVPWYVDEGVETRESDYVNYSPVGLEASNYVSYVRNTGLNNNRTTYSISF